MDDIGFHLRDRHQKNKLLQFIARMLIQGMPKVMRIIGVIGVVAMLMVGGGILIHNVSFLHGFDNFGAELPSVLPQIMSLFIMPIVISLLTGVAMLAIKEKLIKEEV
jgi:predicted DNA repair protein MutK